MATEIPLKIRADIRDLWDSKNSSVQEAVDSLSKTLGYKVIPRAEWSAIWGELKDHFPDKSTFVPTVVRFTVTWYEMLAGRLENDTYSTWTEALLDVLSSAAHGNSLTLHIEPCPPKVSRPNTTWRENSKSFYLGIPNAQPASSAGIQGAFEKDFDNILGGSGETGSKEDDGWADVMEETKEAVRPATHDTASRTTPRSVFAEPPPPRRLPVLNELARPAELLSSTSPYVLIVDHRGDKLWVQSSHEPSLELLASYLKKWGKTNPGDSQRRQVLTIDLKPSDFVMGMNDGLTIETTMNLRNVILNPTVTLAFIQGVLGYKMVYTNGSYWVFKSDTTMK